MMVVPDFFGQGNDGSVIHGYNYTGLYLGVFASSNGATTDNTANYEYFRYAPRVDSRDGWYHRQTGRIQ